MLATIVILLASLVFVGWTLGARLCHAIDEHHPEISAELGPWHETLMQISGSRKITSFVWSRRALELSALRSLVIAIRTVTVVYTLIFGTLFLGFFALLFFGQ